MTEDRPKEKAFRVIDKRHWADDGQDEEATDENRAPSKPYYVMELEKKLEQSEALVKKLSSKLGGSIDDIEDVKSRIAQNSSKEVSQKKRAILTEFLDIMDNLERAISATQETNDLNTLVQGVLMVREQFLDKLASFEVAPIESLGQKFDPKVHDAVTTVPVPSADYDGQIVGIVKQGYKMGDELLRPASVAVGQFQGGLITRPT